MSQIDPTTLALLNLATYQKNQIFSYANLIYLFKSINLIIFNIILYYRSIRNGLNL